MINENKIIITSREPRGNSGTVYLSTTDEKSMPAKLLPCMFSNAIVIGPV